MPTLPISNQDLTRLEEWAKWHAPVGYVQARQVQELLVRLAAAEAAADALRERAMNSIFLIRPYKYYGAWVFDDDKVGLVREAFVGGSDRILDVATAEIPNADKGFLAMFSASPFPGHQVVLEWVRGDQSGNTYLWREKNMEGWLCPALFLYFPTAPAKLYVRFSPVEDCNDEGHCRVSSGGN